MTMTLSELVTHTQARMAKNVYEHAGSNITMLAPTIFFAADHMIMADWLDSIMPQSRQLARGDDMEKLRSSDGAILQMSANSSVQDAGKHAMSRVLPFVINKFKAQAAVWAATALDISIRPDDSIPSSEDDVMDMLRDLGMQWFQEASEVLYIIAVDREVTQTWSARIVRDSDGEFESINEWTMVYEPERVLNLPFEEFTGPAQEALRSL